MKFLKFTSSQTNNEFLLFIIGSGCFNEIED